MALQDWLWLVRLIMEILGLIAKLPKEDLNAIASLREAAEGIGAPAGKPSSTKVT